MYDNAPVGEFFPIEIFQGLPLRVKLDPSIPGLGSYNANLHEMKLKVAEPEALRRNILAHEGSHQIFTDLPEESQRDIVSLLMDSEVTTKTGTHKAVKFLELFYLKYKSVAPDAPDNYFDISKAEKNIEQAKKVGRGWKFVLEMPITNGSEIKVVNAVAIVEELLAMYAESPASFKEVGSDETAQKYEEIRKIIDAYNPSVLEKLKNYGLLNININSLEQTLLNDPSYKALHP